MSDWSSDVCSSDLVSNSKRNKVINQVSMIINKTISNSGINRVSKTIDNSRINQVSKNISNKVSKTISNSRIN